MAKIKFERYKKNPIISPSDNWWETEATFNAGAAVFGQKIILIYRAIGNDHISRFGYAETIDGFKIDKRLGEPIIEPLLDEPFERLGIEDPRITKINNNYLIAYTISSVYNAGHSPFFSTKEKNPNDAPWRVRGAFIKTQDFEHFERIGRILGDEDIKDIILLPEKINGGYALLDRIVPSITLSWSNRLDQTWGRRRVVMTTRKGWEEERIGGSTVPIKTKKGWLIIYHGVDRKKVYRLGFAFLDLNDPTKVIYRHPDPILGPEEDYEKKGRVDNVVFSCGMVEKGGQYFLYYGGADKVLCLATIEKEKLLSVL